MSESETTKSEMKQDGSVFQNFLVGPGGAVRTIEGFCNGILVQYVFDHDYDGNPVMRPVISTICKDAKYSDLLSQAGRNLFTKIETIPLPMEPPND